MSDANTILRREIEAHNDSRGRGGITKVAKILGLGRSTLSVYLTGKYNGSTHKLEKRIIDVLAGSVECPFVGFPITRDECGAQRNANMPTHDAAALKDWQAAQRTCRTCHHNPANKGAS